MSCYLELHILLSCYQVINTQYVLVNKVLSNHKTEIKNQHYSTCKNNNTVHMYYRVSTNVMKLATYIVHNQQHKLYQFVQVQATDNHLVLNV